MRKFTRRSQHSTFQPRAVDFRARPPGAMKCDLPRFVPTVHVRSKPHRSLHTDAETQKIWAGIQHVRRDDRRWLLRSLSAHAPAHFNILSLQLRTSHIDCHSRRLSPSCQAECEIRVEAACADLCAARETVLLQALLAAFPVGPKPPYSGPLNPEVRHEYRCQRAPQERRTRGL
jgi:hypothetical protein